MPDVIDDPIYRYITVKQRESIPLEDFAWPDAPDRPEYPIDTQEHLDSAARLLGHAPENKQASIKARAIRIAKRHGFTLPKSWQKEKEDKKRMDQPDILRTMPSDVTLYMPIVRVDKERREVVVRATSEALDSYKTVFDFEASKEAFSKWRGNIREMHDPTKAVGRALKWEPLEQEKAIDVILRVSKGAPDTWEKVLDNTLVGASVGAKNGVWENRMINGEEVPVLTRYDLVEVSLVDNPANPDCTIQIVRADGIATEQLDTEEDDEQLPPAAEVERNQEPDTTRAGATISHATQGQLHSIRDGLLMQLDRTLDICMCEECAALCALIDPDNDGDYDILPSLDYDHDGGASGDGSGNGSTDPGMMYLSMKAELTRQLSPIITRFNAIGGRLSQVNTTSQADPDTTRRLQAVESKLTELGGMHSLLSEVKGLVERIAAQPQGGGPVINSAALRSAQTQVLPANEDADMIQRLSRAGVLSKQQQINAALYLQKQGVIGE